MKKTKINRASNTAPAAKRATTDPVYTDLLDKAMQSSEDKMKKNVKFRPEQIDATHRFGKRSGST